MARRKAGGLDILDDVIDMTVDSLVNKARDAFQTARDSRQQPALPTGQVIVCVSCGKFGHLDEFQFVTRQVNTGLCTACATFALQAAAEKLRFLAKRAAAQPKAAAAAQPSKPAVPPPWKVLGVDIHASEEEIKKAYRKIVMEWHPDRLPPEQREEAQRRIDEATKARDAMMRVRKAPE